MNSKFYLIVLVLCTVGLFQSTAQSHTYKPKKNRPDTISIWPSVDDTQDTTNKNEVSIPDSLHINQSINTDSIAKREAFIRDSIAIREAFIRDSIAIREAFVRDSIIKREIFVRDSIAKRKRIIDSLTFLKNTLPNYIEASLKTNSEDIILDHRPVRIVGDSILSDYIYNKLVFNLSKPYTPWNSKLNLSTNPIKFKADYKDKSVTYIKFPTYTHKYTYNKRERILKIEENSIVLSKRYGKLFNFPIDSVFYDREGRVSKIKKYHHYYQVVGNYQKGGFLYSHLTQVKQFQYSGGKNISRIEVVKFCDRWRKIDPHKVCNIITFNIQKNGSNYILTRKHDPENVYSDGTFTFTYNAFQQLKSVEFKNNKKSEDWKTLVELNEDGNVSRYVYINKGIINQTVLVNYFDDPKAKYKVETISCFFEDDKISYHQTNNTTGKSRVRDRLTMEWSPWR